MNPVIALRGGHLLSLDLSIPLPILLLLTALHHLDLLLLEVLLALVLLELVLLALVPEVGVVAPADARVALIDCLHGGVAGAGRHVAAQGVRKRYHGLLLLLLLDELLSSAIRDCLLRHAQGREGRDHGELLLRGVSAPAAAPRGRAARRTPTTPLRTPAALRSLRPLKGACDGAGPGARAPVQANVPRRPSRAVRRSRPPCRAGGNLLPELGNDGVQPHP
mmetsp:Transcript_95523/g.265384  ORF Transcript_95523/g.265384 Transcript_95523/m.265384 type:complete len:221 (+) Transcript_95523:341-1003(+)